MPQDLSGIKKMLAEMLQKKQQDKANEDSLRQAKNEGDRNKILENISTDLSDALKPVLNDLAKNSKLSTEDIRAALAEAIQISIPDIKIPDIKIPEIKVPTPQVTVNVPKADAPVVNIPPTVFPDSMALSGITPKTPLHVLMVDQAGKAMMFPQSMGASGGKADFFTILGIQNTILAVNSDPAGVAYSTSNPLPVTITSGSSATSATNIVDSSGVAYSGSNPVPVTFSAASSQNVNVFDAQQSIVTSHQDVSGDFRGLDITNLRTINYVSNYNSTTATFTSGSVFTGLAEDVKDYAVIQVNVFADVASATDGLSVQQSSDGTNWDITDVYNIAASTGKTFSFQVAARYFRLVYTNGGTNQTAFRLQSVFHQTVSKNSSQRPGDGLSNENDFEQVSAYLAALNGAGTWDRLHTGGFDSLGAMRVSMATDSVTSVVINSGTLTTVTTVTGITNSVAIVSLDRDGNPLTTGPIGQGDSATALRVIQAGDSSSSVAASQIGTWTITSITNSVAASLSDSSGVQYSGSNPVPVTLANTGSNQNVNLVGGGSDSVFVYMARTTNPTAVTDGSDVRPSADKLGRTVTRTLQVRDLIVTAYATLTNGTETTLATASAAGYLDLIYVLASNSSSAAQQVDIRAVSGGNIMTTLWVPGNATSGVSLTVPIPQDATGNAWTAKSTADASNSNVLVTALFTKEV